MISPDPALQTGCCEDYLNGLFTRSVTSIAAHLRGTAGRRIFLSISLPCLSSAGVFNVWEGVEKKYLCSQASDTLVWVIWVFKQFNKRCNMKLPGYKGEESATKISPINLNTTLTLLSGKLPADCFWIQFRSQWWHRTLDETAAWKSRRRGTRLNPHLSVALQTYRWWVTASCSAAWCESYPKPRACLWYLWHCEHMRVWNTSTH